MIRDTFGTFASGLALSTADTNLHNVGDVVDLVNVRDIGRGHPTIYLVILIVQAITSGGAATVQFSLVSDSRNPPGVDALQNVHYLSAAIVKATLIAGFQIVIPLPWESPVYAEFLGIQAQAGTNVLTAGAISAFLTMDPSGWKAMPSAVFA